MINFFKKKKEIGGLGARPDTLDIRDRKYEERMGTAPLSSAEWNTGYDIEKELNFKLPFKNQGGTLSCTGQAGSYYAGVLDQVELKKYNEVSAKAYYSQVFLSEGGAYIRDVVKLVVNWGGLRENVVSSYINGSLPTENFIRDVSWKNEDIDKSASILKAKEYRVITDISMDSIARAIKDGYGCIAGVYVGDNGSWRTNDPTPSTRSGGHAIYFGKFGVDEKGKFISTINSWGERKTDSLHPDGWQKLREDYFNSTFMFNNWVILDAPNEEVNGDLSNPDVIKIIREREKQIVIEGEAPGRKGIIINGKLREITKERSAEACLYSLANNTGVTVKKSIFDKLPKDVNF